MLRWRPNQAGRGACSRGPIRRRSSRRASRPGSAAEQGLPNLLSHPPVYSYAHEERESRGRADAYADRFEPYPYVGDADFNFRSFRTTNVLRWEYQPGSALFVVWQQGRQEDGDRGDFRFGRDFGGLFSAPARNVFLVKFSYWINH